MPTPEWIVNLNAKIYQDVSARYQASINPQGLSTSFDASQPVANSQGPSIFSAASDLNATIPWQPVNHSQGPSIFTGASDLNATMPLWQSAASPQDPLKSIEDTSLTPTLPL
jgi:hypothetical protein